MKTSQPYRVMDVASYIVNYANQENISLHNLQLQKILYFCQAYFLVITGEPCFDEPILAWDCGPTILSVYDNFKRHGLLDIYPVSDYRLRKDPDKPWRFDNWITVEYHADSISRKHKKMIREVFMNFANKTNSSMLALIYQQDPFIKARTTGAKTVSLHNMKEYFSTP